MWQNKKAMESIIGRKKEQKELEQVYNSNKAEFVVVYGRRRVGKTYLVREYFQDRLDFYHTALSPIELEEEKLAEGDRAQIDMLIDRADRVVNVCEIKYSTDDYTIDKKYDAELRRKLDVFANETKCRKALHTTLVTTYGLVKNEYSGRIQNVITMDSLFD